MALVNPAIRAATAVGMVASANGTPCPWSDESRAAADRLDLVARAGAIAARDPQPALLVVSGSQDDPVSRADAADLSRELKVDLTAVPGLAHSLAEGPSAIVDDAVTAWFQQHLIGR